MAKKTTKEEEKQTAKDLAHKILTQATPAAAQTLVNLSQHAESESVRASCSKTIIAYNISEKKLSDKEDESDVWDEGLKDITEPETV